MVSPEDKLCATLATFVCLVAGRVTARDGEAGRCVDQGGKGEGGVPQSGRQGWGPLGASGSVLSSRASADSWKVKEGVSGNK